METWYTYGHGQASPKPEGFWVEIADLCIRLADTMGAYELEYQEQITPVMSRKPIPEFINWLHWRTAAMSTHEGTWSSNVQTMISSVLNNCFDAARVHGEIDLFAVIREKMAYNATRPIRHGGLLA